MVSSYCRFLERVCGLKSLSAKSKRQIVDRFLAVHSEEELRQLVESVRAKLVSVSANPDYFTV